MLSSNLRAHILSESHKKHICDGHLAGWTARRARSLEIKKPKTAASRAVYAKIVDQGVHEGHGPARDGMLGQFTGKEEPDGGLDLPGGDG